MKLDAWLFGDGGDTAGEYFVDNMFNEIANTYVVAENIPCRTGLF